MVSGICAHPSQEDAASPATSSRGLMYPAWANSPIQMPSRATMSAPLPDWKSRAAFVL